MKELKNNYANYSINELEQIFEKQTEKIRKIKEQKERVNKNSHKIFGDVYLPKLSDKDLQTNKKYHKELQKLNELHDENYQTLIQVGIELSKKKKEKLV